MLKNKLFAIVLVIFLLIVLAGCNKSFNNLSDNSLQPPNGLSVYFDYYEEYESPIKEKLVAIFSEMYPDIDIVIYDPIGGDTTMSTENAYYKLNTDIMSGGGPDVIISTGRTLPSKVYDSGIFTDLNQFISNDDSFGIDDYNSSVINAGIIEQERLFLPFLYNVTYLQTTETKLNDISAAPGEMTQNVLIDLCKKSFDADMIPMTEHTLFTIAGFSLLSDIIDYENKAVNDDNPYLREVIDLWKKIRNEDNVLADAYAYEAVYENDYLFFSNLNSFYQVNYYNLCADECVVLEAPNTSEGATAFVSYTAAINRNCDHPQLAWEFVKNTVSEDFQANISLHGRIPVLTEYQDEFYNLQCRQFSALDKEHTARMEKDFTDALNGITDAVTPQMINDIDLFVQMFEPYVVDEKSFEDCLTEAKNYFSIYLAE